MDTTTAVVATAVVVTAGEWAKNDKGPSIKIVVGGMVLAMFLSALSTSNDKFAAQFSVLILMGALFTYIIPITKKLGFTK